MSDTLDLEPLTDASALASGPGGTGRLALLLADAFDGMDRGAADWLGPLPPGGPLAVRAAVRASGFGQLSDFGADPYETLSALARILSWGAADPAHPHCAAHLHCPPLAIAVAAETVVASLNQSLDSWDQSPACGEIEQAVIETLASAVGYSSSASGVITSGGTESNLMALLMARDAVLRHRFDADPDLDGIPAAAAGRLRVVASELAHFSVARNAALLGIGERGVVPVVADRDGRMCAHAAGEAMARIVDRGEIPMAVVGTAGTTDHGAVDPLPALAQIASPYGAWFHVDAAYGGGTLLGLGTRHQELLRGIEKADSVTLDLHKLGWQPVAAGAFLVREAASMRTIEKRVAYLNPLDDEEAGYPSLLGRSLRTTRRADAVKIAATFKSLGRKGFDELTGRCLDLARYAAKAVGQRPELELETEPVLTTVLFRYLPQHHQADADVDRINAALRRRLLAAGRAVVGRTELPRRFGETGGSGESAESPGGRLRLKLTLLNPHTTERQIDDLLDAVVGAGIAVALERM